MATSIDPASISLAELTRYLMDHDIPVDVWGTGPAKTVGHLLKEIKSRECNLIEVDGELIREIYMVSVNVFYEDSFGTFKLKEEKQIFKDGRAKKRSLESSLSEKIKSNEIPVDGIIRGISEELNLSISPDQVREIAKFKESRESNSFPGLSTVYNGTRFSCRLNRNQYNPNGYIEIQEDKTVYFVWERTNKKGLE